MATSREIESVCEVAASSLGYSSLKEHQLSVVRSFVGGNDVFAVLPTGYSKTLCFAILPNLFDRLLCTNGSIVVVLTPLTAIIKDQVCSLTYKVSVFRASVKLKLLSPQY